MNPILTPARRVASSEDLEQPGDYALDTIEDSDGASKRCVWFLLPIHRPGETRFDRSSPGSGLHMVTEPPWTLRECPDGSIEIRASIGSRWSTADDVPEGAGPYYWHGYLDEGNVWRQLVEPGAITPQ